MDKGSSLALSFLETLHHPWFESMTYPYAIYDVFTQTPFAGNPLAVVFEAQGLTDEAMYIAVVASVPMRIFMPVLLCPTWA